MDLDASSLQSELRNFFHLAETYFGFPWKASLASLRSSAADQKMIFNFFSYNFSTGYFANEIKKDWFLPNFTSNCTLQFHFLIVFSLKPDQQRHQTWKASKIDILKFYFQLKATCLDELNHFVKNYILWNSGG